ncbi:hypothetical protein ACVW1B_003762 [Bradyrhizobium sp. USDA 4502]
MGQLNCPAQDRYQVIDLCHGQRQPSVTKPPIFGVLRKVGIHFPRKNRQTKIGVPS